MRRLTASILAAIALAWSQDTGATLEGHVRDAHDKAVAGAAVHVTQTGGQRLTTHTDADGAYRFAGLPAGTYTLHAEMAALGAAAFGPFVVGQKETKKVDLTLAKPELFDEANFVVAGVTTPTHSGIHGPDTAVRSAEALTKATASLARATPPAAKADTAQQQHALAQQDEKLGNALEAAREYQRAAELEPSEPYLFDWGSDLLTHRAAEPATEVFVKGHRLFPDSMRMLLGLAAGWYARGAYDQAARYFFAACDLDPTDPEPYMFLGKAQSIEVTPGFLDRMARFARFRPDDAWANYYYAVSLGRSRTGPGDLVEPLLKKAVQLDPKLAAAYLQLGIFYAGRKNLSNAIAAYQQAIQVSPEIEEAHYRLAQVYRQTGETQKADQELALFEKLSKQSATKAQRERDEIPQLVFSLRH